MASLFFLRYNRLGVTLMAATRLEKMTMCEYPAVDTESDPCHNPPVFIDRKGGHVVCANHVEALDTFLANEPEIMAERERLAKLKVAKAAAIAAARVAAFKQPEPVEPEKPKGFPMTAAAGGIMPGVK